MNDPEPVLRGSSPTYRERVRSLAKIAPSRQIDVLPDETRADVAAVRAWMDRENERARRRSAERAEETWNTLGPPPGDDINPTLG